MSLFGPLRTLSIPELLVRSSTLAPDSYRIERAAARDLIRQQMAVGREELTRLARGEGMPSGLHVSGIRKMPRRIQSHGEKLEYIADQFPYAFGKKTGKGILDEPFLRAAKEQYVQRSMSPASIAEYLENLARSYERVRNIKRVMEGNGPAPRSKKQRELDDTVRSILRNAGNVEIDSHVRIALRGKEFDAHPFVEEDRVKMHRSLGEKVARRCVNRIDGVELRRGFEFPVERLEHLDVYDVFGLSFVYHSYYEVQAAASALHAEDTRHSLLPHGPADFPRPRRRIAIVSTPERPEEWFHHSENPEDYFSKPKTTRPYNGAVHFIIQTPKIGPDTIEFKIFTFEGWINAHFHPRADHYIYSLRQEGLARTNFGREWTKGHYELHRQLQEQFMETLH